MQIREKDFIEMPAAPPRESIIVTEGHYYVIQLASRASSARGYTWVSEHFGQSTWYDHIKLHLTETQHQWFNWIRICLSHITSSLGLHSCHADLGDLYKGSSSLSRLPPLRGLLSSLLEKSMLYFPTPLYEAASHMWLILFKFNWKFSSSVTLVVFHMFNCHRGRWLLYCPVQI